MKTTCQIGLVGCGDIARKAYGSFVKTRPELTIAACTDVREEVARKLAADLDIPRVLSLEDMLADPEIDVILNLTHPAAHASVNLRALEHGKHTYCEKPFALTREEGLAVLKKAQAAGLRVGCAPDTVLGAGTQSARAAIDRGLIGQPIAARLMWCSGGHESWHPNPAFYYQKGGGPMLDMGPYFLSSLVQLIGPMRSVTGRCKISQPERTITSQPLHGTVVPVEAPTHYSGVVETASGVHALTLMSFDVRGGSDFDRMPEIIGTEGTLKATDPNGFGGTLAVRKAGEKEFQEIPSTHDYEGGRGLGLADMILAIREDRPHRASGEIAYHVLDAMLAFEDAERTGRRIDLDSTCRRPDAMPESGI